MPVWYSIGSTDYFDTVILKIQYSDVQDIWDHTIVNDKIELI